MSQQHHGLGLALELQVADLRTELRRQKQEQAQELLRIYASLRADITQVAVFIQQIGEVTRTLNAQVSAICEELASTDPEVAERINALTREFLRDFEARTAALAQARAQADSPPPPARKDEA